MIVEAEWSHVLLGAGGGSRGHRVKRQTAGAPPPVVASGVDRPGADSWASAPAPAVIRHQGRDYILAFWSVRAVDSAAPYQRSAQIQTNSVANDSHAGGSWRITARAYYVWNQGGGPGNHALLIDAFDIDAGDFLADDFVTVTPDDPRQSLTLAANDGYLNTSQQILPGVELTVAATDIAYVGRSGYGFQYWLPISALTHSGDPAHPATIGAPTVRDILVHRDDIIMAFAMYQPAVAAPLPGTDWATIDLWWWFTTHGGLVPPRRVDGWLRDFGNALALAESARGMSQRLQEKALRLAAEQVAESAAKLKEQIKTTGKG